MTHHTSTYIQPETILIVDDDPAHRDSLMRIFLRANYEIESAANGHAAIEWLKNKEFSIVLTDLIMPNIDGIAIIQASKKIQPDTPILLMTAYSSLENAVAAMREGAYNFLAKPIRRNELLLAIEKALEFRKLSSENTSLKKILNTHHHEKQMMDTISVNSHQNTYPISAEIVPFRVGMTLEQIEEAMIRATLESVQGDKPKAAKILGIGLRTLYRKIEQFNIGLEPN
jgi:DNA-binding NtrC family response regulator